MSVASDRIFGLDLMRAVAILLVVFWHSYDAITYLAPGFHMPFFLDGVDLFFVLSGYLIGGILLRQLHGPGSWRERILGFWQRRFFRTLPNYYLFLVINLLLLWIGIGPGLLNHNALAYFAFLQNVWEPLDLFFWESWSLVVEVWFYVLFPLLFICLRALRAAARPALAITVGIFLVGPLLMRFALAPYIATIADGELTVRKLVITRLDTVVFGVVAALFHARSGAGWSRSRLPLFLLGLTGMLLAPMFYGPSHLHYSLTWYYTLNAVAMTMLLPMMSKWTRAPVGGRLITWLSLVSYALFLVHMPLRRILEPHYDPNGAIPGWIQLFAYWSLCLMLAWAVYRFFEKPMMDLRERFVRR